jgi:hypothetical protein
MRELDEAREPGWSLYRSFLAVLPEGFAVHDAA